MTKSELMGTAEAFGFKDVKGLVVAEVKELQRGKTPCEMKPQSSANHFVTMNNENMIKRAVEDGYVARTDLDPAACLTASQLNGLRKGALIHRLEIHRGAIPNLHTENFQQEAKRSQGATSKPVIQVTIPTRRD